MTSLMTTTMMMNTMMMMKRWRHIDAGKGHRATAPATHTGASWFFHHISLSSHPKWKRTMVLEKIPVIGFTSCQNIRVLSIAIRGRIGLSSILENAVGFSKKRLCFISRQSLHKEAYGRAQKTTRNGVALPYDVLTRIHCLYTDLNIYYYMVGTRAHD